MRPFPANKRLPAVLFAALIAAASSAQAASRNSLDAQSAAMASSMASQAVGQGMAQGLALAQKAGRQQGSGDRTFYNKGEREELTATQLDALLGDPESPQSKAENLAAKHSYQRDLQKNLLLDSGDDLLPPPPMGLEDLQDIEGYSSSGVAALEGESGLPSNPGDEKPSGALDLRFDAQKEAALSFGARGGLAKRNYQIMERLNAFEATLDKVFDFRALLVKAPSGLLIEPPIVRESVNSLVVTAGGDEAAVADRIYDINKQAKIVTAPRDWRQYLLQNWVSRVPSPPRLLWPQNAAERARWKRWVGEGWRAGQRQADDMFQANIARLLADFNGMIRYRTLLTQGMISQPYAMHEDRGVTGSKTLMRVGDRALRITGPSQFLTTGTDLWKPADR